MPKFKDKSEQMISKVDTSKDNQKRIDEINEKIGQKLSELGKFRNNRPCFPLLMGESSIVSPIVDNIFEKLRTDYKNCNGKLDVIIESGGGDI
ncbi:MAG: hypothetical protein ACREAE_05580, partial [Nitrosopumilaceae archaeon]